MTITESHYPNSPQLLAIALADRKRKPYRVNGLDYQLKSWEAKGDRVIVTLEPFRGCHGRAA